MVKEFRVVLAPPPQNGYVTNSEVTGHVVLVTDEAKSGYKTIEVTLKGYGKVRWSENRGSGENQHTVTYHSLVSSPDPSRRRTKRRVRKGLVHGLGSTRNLGMNRRS